MRRNLPNIITVATTSKLTFELQLLHCKNNSRRATQFKMSVEREKDKSKLHKLSLKGQSAAYKFRAMLTKSQALPNSLLNS